MHRFDPSKLKGFFAGRGLYIALALVLLVSGAIGYGVLRPKEPVREVAAPAPVIHRPQPPAPPKEPPRPAQPIEPPVQHEAEAMEPVEAEDLLPEVMSPLDGTTVTVFSMTELLYDETMGDWRTHEGLDIQAGEGDAVKTAADGEVTEVRDDEMMGTTVIVAHADGYATQYSALQPEVPVKAGDKLHAGDIVGYVGNTAAAESEMGPHLHFAVTKDGKIVDPKEYVN